MNRQIAFLMFLMFQLCSAGGRAQINTGFIRHLSSQKLEKEHWAYLQRFDPSSDSGAYFRSKFGLQYSNDSLFLSDFRRSSALFLSDTGAVNYASVHMLKANSKLREEWFGLTEGKTTGYYSASMAFAYHCTLDPEKADVSALPEDLRSDFLKFKKVAKKKPVLAAGLSALLPGAGQLYNGRKKSFFPTFALHAFYGLQTYESIRRDGIRSPLSIINIGAFTFFYFANIYGSYRDTKQSVHETKQQFLINASDHYSILSAPAL
jgi:hypothetical protein